MIEDQKPKIIKEIDDLIGAISYQLRGSNLIGQNKKPVTLKQPKNIIGGDLKDYQLQSLAWMVELANNNLSGILADDMGLGKTVQAIAYMSYVQDTKKINGKHIVIVPKNVLNNWKREFTHWNPKFRVVTLPGTEEQREHVLKTYIKTSQFDVLIATYYSVQACESTLKRFLWETLVVDEAHSIKNSDTSISNCLRKFRSKFSLLLTGTPLSNDLSELWSLLNFIVPELFSDCGLFERIEKSVDSECKSEQDKIKYQSQIAARFKAVISPFMLRRVKSEINLGLKQKKEISIFVSLSQIQLTMYRNFLKTKSVYGDESRTQQGKPAQLRKICGHPYLFSDIQDPNAPPYGDHLIETSGKLKLLDKLLIKLFKQNHKVLIFSQFVIMLKILEDYCTYREYKYEVISGESTLQQRDDAIDRFSKRKDTNIFLISTRAGGIGLNLVAADIVIMYDLDWNPQMDKQAMDRAYRIGQKRSVKIFKLVTNNTIEQRILQVQKYKLIWDELVIQKGGLAKIKSAEQKFQKMDLNNLAGWGAEEIFKFQQNYDDNTIEQIIKMSEQRDNKVTDEIKKKLQKEFENVGETLNPYQFFQNFEGKDVGKEFKPKILGESKLDKRAEKLKNSKKLIRFIEPKAFQLYENNKQAGELLFNLQQNVVEQQRQKLIEELRSLGFYDWSLSEYEQFVQANCNVDRTDYKEISRRINTKNESEVKEYSVKYYEKAQKIGLLKKDIKKMMKRQKQIECEQQLKRLQQVIKTSDWDLFYLKIKSTQKSMNNDTYLRMYFNDARIGGKELKMHEEIIQRLNGGLLNKIQKIFAGQNKNMMYKKIVEQIEEGNDKNTEILNSRYQVLYKKYTPELSLAKPPSKNKQTVVDDIEKDEESNETVAKNELQVGY